MLKPRLPKRVLAVALVLAGAVTLATILTTGPHGAQDRGVATVSPMLAALNNPPVAVDDTATTWRQKLAQIDVLANDSDADGDVLTLTAVGPPSHGQTSLVERKVWYQPAYGFVGEDAVTYKRAYG